MKVVRFSPNPKSKNRLIHAHNERFTHTSSAAMEELSDDDGDFTPLETMPTSRLNDVLAMLNKKTGSVINVDACIPPKESGESVLKTILYKITPCVKVLSLRFNQFSQNSIDLLISWIASNDHLETLYIMGSMLDEKSRSKLEEAWRKKLTGHRTNNLGYTFIRVTHDKALVVVET